VPDEVMRIIHDSGMFKNPKQKVLRWAGLQFVDETAKERMRAILWTRQMNDELEKPLKISPVGDCVSSAQLVDKNSYARQWDLTRGFYQLQIKPHLWKYHGVKINRRSYVFTRAEMGANWAVDACHACLDLALAIARVRARQDGVPRDTVNKFVYVDNVKISGAATHKDHVDCLAEKLMATLHEFNFSFREEGDGVFLGMRCDHRKGVVSLTDDFMQRLEEGQHEVLGDGAAPTWAEARSFFARCNFAMRVLRIAQAHHFVLWKFVRRRCARDTNPSDAANIWPCARTDWELLLAEIREHNKEGVSHSGKPLGDARFLLYMDSSVQGWGAVLFNQLTGEVSEYGEPWLKRIESRDIPLHETRAVSLALEHFRPLLARHEAGEICLLTDSTSTLGALMKGGSARFHMNVAVKKALSVFASLDKWTIKIAHVISAAQLADAKSRGLVVSRKELRSQLGLEWGAVMANQTRSVTRRRYLPRYAFSNTARSRSG